MSNDPSSSDTSNASYIRTLTNLLTGQQFVMTALITYLAESSAIDRGDFVEVLKRLEKTVADEAKASGQDPDSTTLAIRQTIGMLERTTKPQVSR